MHFPADAYAARITALHRALGLPTDYAARRGLPLQPEADEATLVTIAQKDDGTPVRLIPSAAAAWHRLHAAARDAGHALLPLSGFRSVDRQAAIIRQKLAAGRPLADILTSIAAPGHSEHHTGRALDLGAPGAPVLEAGFADCPAYRWLVAEAAGYDFHLSYPEKNLHGIVFEPWHWCWRV